MAHTNDTELSNIANKIQQLLNKTTANGATEEEAKSALLMAQRLMKKYNIAEDSLGDSEHYTYSLQRSDISVKAYSKRLSVIIANSFAVEVILSNNKIVFFGRTNNAIAAKTAFEFTHKVMKRGMNAECRRKGFDGTECKGASLVYNAYVHGFLSGYKAALDEQTRALAIVVPQDVHDAFHKTFPNVRSARRSSMTAGNYMDSYDRGVSDGRNANNQRALENK